MDDKQKGGPPHWRPPSDTTKNQQVNNNPLLDAALPYVARGWPVLPLHSVRQGCCTCGKSECASVGKHPRTSHGVKDASRDPATIRQWWSRWPDANIGIATGGESRQVVVDIDPRNGGNDSLNRIEREHGPTRTYSVRTGGNGRHDYFRYPIVAKIGCPKGGWAGIDIKGEGGYIVAPPSLHASGTRYELIDDLPLATVPDWLLETLKQPADRQGSNGPPEIQVPLPSVAPAPRSPAVAAAMQGVPEGERNDTLYRYVSSLRARNVQRGEAEVLVRAFAARCTPPLPADEAQHALDSAWKHSPGFHLTDSGNAQRLAYQHGRDIRYGADMGHWIVWDGNRWRPDTAEIEITRRAKDTARSIYAEAGDEDDMDRRRSLASWARQSEGAARIEAMIKLARSEPDIAIHHASALDADSMLLGVLNGTLDLSSGQLRAARPEDYITRLALVSFEPDARCPRWLQFLHEITGCDEDLIAFLQRMAGYALSGDTREQCIFVLYGTGVNGKSVFTTVIQHLLGEYACTMLAETLMARGYQGAPTAELAVSLDAAWCSLQKRRMAPSLPSPW